MASKLIWAALAGGLLAYVWKQGGQRAAGGVTGSTAAGAAHGVGDSPNAGERLQQSHLGGAYAGIGTLLPDGGQNTTLLPASSGTGMPSPQSGGPSGMADEESATPRLNEMFRGA